MTKQQPASHALRTTHTPRWPAIEQAITSSLPLGPSSRDITRITGFSARTVAYCIQNYLDLRYIVGAGVNGNRRYYLTQQQADDAKDLRDVADANVKPRTFTPKQPVNAPRLRAVLVECDRLGATLAELCAALGIGVRSVQKAINMLRLDGKAFMAGGTHYARCFAEEAQAIDYNAMIAQRKDLALKERIDARNAKRAAATAERREAAGLKPLTRTRRTKQTAETKALGRMTFEWAERKKADKALAGKQLVVPNFKPATPRPAFIDVAPTNPSGVKPIVIERKPGRYEVTDAPSMFASLKPGQYLDLPSRIPALQGRSK